MDAGPPDAGAEVPGAWTCAAEAFADGEQCDCGCSIADPDCESGAAESDCDYAWCDGAGAVAPDELASDDVTQCAEPDDPGPGDDPSGPGGEGDKSEGEEEGCTSIRTPDEGAPFAGLLLLGLVFALALPRRRASPR